MAPVKGKGKSSGKVAGSGKGAGSGKSAGSGKGASKPPSASSSNSSKKRGKGPPPTQVKTKPAKTAQSKKLQKRSWTAEQLGVPKLNAITPVGVQKPQGKKKGKVFVDDPHTMQTILAMVNAETEGKIESKMLRARHMEEIREARRKEADAKEQARKDRIENKKDELRQGRRRGKSDVSQTDDVAPVIIKKKKKVSFG